MKRFLSAAFLLLPPLAAHHDDDHGVCDSTAQGMRQSCRYEARADHMLTVASCRNMSDANERHACLQQAVQDLNDALQECEDQYHARRDVCEELGGEAYDPAIDPRNFVRDVDNPYFPLVPGTTLVYEGQTSKGLEHDEVQILADTRVILGVTCTTVHDVSTVAGELAEDTLDYYAQDADGNVWYFGENTHTVENGLIVSLEGSWIAGESGAKPGIIMQAHPELGQLYRQEFALGVGEDVARLVARNQTITVRYGTMTDCWKTEDFTAIEPGVVENKFFAPGIGSVMEIDLSTGEILELVDIQH